MPLLFRPRFLLKPSLNVSRSVRSKFIEIDSLKHLPNIITPNSLLFFDLDNTLITPKQTIGSDQWFYWHMLKFNLEITLPLYHLAQKLTEVYLIEVEVAQLIKQLRKSHYVFGLTSRGNQLKDATQRQLQSVDIEFDSVDDLLKHKSQDSQRITNCINNGVIFTGGKCKGNMLEMLHTHLRDSAPRYFENQVVLIDDTQSKLDAFIDVCDRLGLNGLAVRYNAMDSRLEVNPSVAKIQEQKLRDESYLISDEEALEVLKNQDINRYFDGVVRIECVQLSYDYTRPRSAPQQQICSGSGFVVQDYILTNAHVISGAQHIRLKTSNMHQYVTPKVEFVDHYHDVALLKVEDPKFWQGIQALELSVSEVSLNSRLHVVGYPMGGNEICVTKGIASRIELDSTAYYGKAIHKIQVDAAVNAGNSGGPVLCNNTVIGMIVDGIDGANNINYMIPASVLNNVICAYRKQKATKCKFDFYVTLISNQAIINKLIEKDLGVYSFLLVSDIDKKKSLKCNIRKGDMIIAVNGCSLLDNGLVSLDGRKLNYEHLLHFNDELELSILRDKRILKVTVKLIKDIPDESIESIVSDYSKPPEISKCNSLVFQQISDCLVKQLHNSETYVSKELLDFNCKESRGVVISEFLNHEDFLCYSDYLNIPIISINNTKIKTLDDASNALKKSDIITICFANNASILIEQSKNYESVKPRFTRPV